MDPLREQCEGGFTDVPATEGGEIASGGKKISSPSLLDEELFGSEINEEKGGTYLWKA